MPKGPQGQKRPADVVGAAIKVAKIATGEIEEDADEPQSAPPHWAVRAAGRAERMAAERRTEIARSAAKKRRASKNST